MSFGSRRFAALVAKDSVVDGKRVREYFARFLPLDLGSEGEQVDEATLRRAVDDNAREAFPVPDGEEKLALAAFKAQHGGKATSRARMAAQAERTATRQTSTLDVFPPHERVTVERFRKLLTLKELPPTASFPEHDSGAALKSSRHDLLDTAREVLSLVDLYLPKPKIP